MKKEGKLLIFLFTLVILSMSSIIADNSTSNSTLNDSLLNTSLTGLNSDVGTISTTSASDNTAINNAYTCLDNQIKNKTSSSISLEEAVYTTLALGYRKVAQDKIDSEKNSIQDCWSNTKGCNLKETAQVLLAYQKSGRERSNIVNWLLSNNATSNDLNWYLEIDIANKDQSQCTLSYDGVQKKITVNSDMTISGTPGNCFSISSNGYWLLFRQSCYDDNIQISCDKDFLTATAYQKKNDQTVYVLPSSNSASALGSTTAKVSVNCFKTGNTCDYEGSLWATIALSKEGKNVDSYLPYLIALADSNEKYFPEAFLYYLTGSDSQYSQVIQNQQNNRLWNVISSPYGQFYDTALAMLTIGATSSPEVDNAKSYLLSIQGSDGCWDNDNIRNTAFLLYGGWSRSGTTSSGGSGDLPICTGVSTQSCENMGDCINAGGSVLNNFQCVSGLSVCCSVKVPLLSCSAKQGTICSSDQVCSGNNVVSSDGNCCVGSCVAPSTGNTCTLNNGICRNSCNSGESQDSTSTCDSGNICCMPSTSSSPNWILIIILLLLCILIVLAIIFRHELQIWWFKFRGNAKVTPVVKPSSPGTGQGFSPMNRIQNAFRPSPVQTRPVAQQPIRRPATGSQRDKEMEETLRKLREMSK